MTRSWKTDGFARVLLGVVALVGCEVPRTQLVVGVDAELTWGEGQALESVVLEVRRGDADGPLRSRRVTALGTGPGRQGLPLWVTVLSGDDDDRSPVWLEALGCARADGCMRENAVVAQRATVTFVRGRAAMVRLLLARICSGRSCALSERCAVDTGRCIDADARDEIEPYVEELPQRWADAGSAGRDAGVDAGVDAGEGMGVDAGLDAGLNAGLDAGDDGAVEAGVDVGSDVGVDAGDDTGIDVPRDTSINTGIDTGARDTGPLDMGLPPPVDTGPPPPADRGNPGRGAFLDLCASGSDCMSGDCFVAPGAQNGFCTRPCTATFYGGCGVGLACAFGPGGSSAGRCVIDDTGAPCLVQSSTCARHCYRGGSGNPAHCTRECNTARDCPAGFACQPTTTAMGITRVCVDVERPCTRAADCPTNLCQGNGSFVGCTALCTLNSDCPARLRINVGSGQVVDLPPWECLTVGGLRRCVPPRVELGGDLEGADPLGGVCRPTTGGNRCYSGVCDHESNTCVQGCSPAGGCPSNTACRTWLPDGPSGQLLLVCRPNGNLPPGAPCNAATQCQTALCLGEGAAGYCTRWCTSDDCPTGMRCTPVGMSLNGIPLSHCQR